MTTDQLTLPGEEWLPVVGYEGHYEVSNLGRLRSVPRVVQGAHGDRRLPGRMMRTPLDRAGYQHAALSKDGVGRSWKLHRLVAMAFWGTPPTLEHEVCHNDGDKLNNRADNLRWGTRAENVADAIKHGAHFWASRDECSKGHPYTPDNTYVNPEGERVCRTCSKVYQARYNARRRTRQQKAAA